MLSTSPHDPDDEPMAAEPSWPLSMRTQRSGFSGTVAKPHTTKMKAGASETMEASVANLTTTSGPQSFMRVTSTTAASASPMMISW